MSRPLPRRGHPAATATALVVTVLWSTSWVLIRFGLDDEELAPLTFAALRYLLAAAVLCGVAVAGGRTRRELAGIDRRSLGRLALLGIVLYAVTQGAQFVAIDSQPAATTSLVLSLTPLAVAAVAARSVGERAHGRQVGGAVLVAAGAWLYLSGDLGATAVGMTAAAVGLTANVVATLLGRAVNRTGAHSPAAVTTTSMGIGAVVLALVAIGTEGWPTVTPRAALLVAWLAVVNTALAFTLWNRSMRRLSALESAGINNTMLVQIALLAWAFLDEAPGVGGLAGIVAVSGGVLLIQLPTSVGARWARRG